MRRMNLAEGVLVFLGLVLVVNALIIKMWDYNVMYPMLESMDSCFTVANTCFLSAFVIATFGRKPEE